MMTTMAALLGGVPLMLGPGTGSELRQPLGYTMVGGLLVSQALTLFTTPVIYLYLDRLSKWLTGGSGKKKPPKPKTAQAAPEAQPEPPFADEPEREPAREPEWANEHAKAAE